MLKIGLTGGIGSGKTKAAEIFKSLGAAVIDADTISHQVTVPGSDCLREIRDQLGAEFLTDDNALDRKKLAAYIFSHADKKSVLEAILHPRIRLQMLHEIEKLENADYVILVVPLLFETNFIELVDRVLVVDAAEPIRIQRVMARDSRSEEQIRNILKNQLDQSVRTENADDILDNNESLEKLQSSVEQLHRKYLKMAGKI